MTKATSTKPKQTPKKIVPPPPDPMSEAEDQPAAEAVEQEPAGVEDETAEHEPPRSTIDQADGDQLTAADLIEPDQMYGPGMIEALLGIKQRTVVNGFNQYRGKIFMQHTGSGSGITLLGRQVLRWIAEADVPYKVTQVGIKRYRRLHPEPQAEEPKPEAKSVLDQAAELVEQSKRAEQQKRSRWQEDAWDSYLAIISRFDQPQDGDANNLAVVMEDLGITHQQAQEDAKITTNARQLEKLHHDRQAAAAARVKANEEYRAMERRHEQEEKERFTAQRQASGHYTGCHNAHSELTKLAKRRPQLFDMSSDPPSPLKPKGD